MIISKKTPIILSIIGVIIIGTLSLGILPGGHLLSSVLDDTNTIAVVDPIDPLSGKPLSELSTSELETLMDQFSQEIDDPMSGLKKQKTDLETKITTNGTLLSAAQKSLPTLTSAYELASKNALPFEKAVNAIEIQIQAIHTQIETSKARKTYCENLVTGLPNNKKNATTEKTLLTTKTIPGVKTILSQLDKDKKRLEGKINVAGLILQKNGLDSTSQKSQINQLTTKINAAKASLKLSFNEVTELETNPQNVINNSTLLLDDLIRVSSDMPGKIQINNTELATLNQRVAELTKTLGDIASCPGEIVALKTKITTTLPGKISPTSALGKQLTTAKGKLDTYTAAKELAKTQLESAQKIIDELPVVINTDTKKLEGDSETGEKGVKQTTSEKVAMRVQIQGILRNIYQEQFTELDTEKNALETQYNALPEQRNQLLQELSNLDQNMVQEQITSYDDNGEEYITYRETNPNAERATELVNQITTAENTINTLQQQLVSISVKIENVIKAINKNNSIPIDHEIRIVDTTSNSPVNPSPTPIVPTTSNPYLPAVIDLSPAAPAQTTTAPTGPLNISQIMQKYGVSKEEVLAEIKKSEEGENLEYKGTDTPGKPIRWPSVSKLNYWCSWDIYRGTYDARYIDFIVEGVKEWEEVQSALQKYTQMGYKMKEVRCGPVCPGGMVASAEGVQQGKIDPTAKVCRNERCPGSKDFMTNKWGCIRNEEEIPEKEKCSDGKCPTSCAICEYNASEPDFQKACEALKSKHSNYDEWFNMTEFEANSPVDTGKPGRAIANPFLKCKTSTRSFLYIDVVHSTCANNFGKATRQSGYAIDALNSWDIDWETTDGRSIKVMDYGCHSLGGTYVVNGQADANFRNAMTKASQFKGLLMQGGNQTFGDVDKLSEHAGFTVFSGSPSSSASYLRSFASCPSENSHCWLSVADADNRTSEPESILCGRFNAPERFYCKITSTPDYEHITWPSGMSLFGGTWQKSRSQPNVAQN